MRRRALPLLAILGLPGCGDGGVRILSDDPGPPSGSITVEGRTFTPRTLTLRSRAVVTWSSADATAHSIDFDSGSVSDPGALAPFSQRSTRLNEPGTYAFRCRIHPEMRGSIVVR